MSQIRTFLIPPAPDGEVEAEVNAFLRSHRVLDIQRVYDAKGWHILVEWLDGTPDSARGARFAERIDYMKELPPAVFAVFSKLRIVRKELAREAGVPPFGVATDAQLAEMAKMEEPSAAKLEKIEGFGQARMKAYGEKLLAVLANREKPENDPPGR